MIFLESYVRDRSPQISIKKNHGYSSNFMDIYRMTYLDLFWGYLFWEDALKGGNRTLASLVDPDM